MFDVSNVTTEALEAFDEMMVECATKVEKIAPLAVSLWSGTLKELDKRGRVKLISGAYDDVGNALVQRLR